ncbi:MAG: N-acetylneuraminate synthase family protein [Proteobacteria bacterium]|nr:N-acetylneuraminate synthase family protein [Pseudomonadota bacterium]
MILNLIRINGGFPVVLLNSDNSLFGLVSTGNIASFLARNPSQKIENLTAETVANQSPLVGHVSDSVETIEGYLSEQNIRSLPILDISRRVVRVVSRQEPFLRIGQLRAGCQSPPLLLAEIGVNHNGDSNEALWLVRQAAAAGCDAVKFQRRSNNLYNQEEINSFDLGTQYIIAEIERTRLPISSIVDCCHLARDLGMEAVITPFDEIALREVMDSDSNPAALKIASCDLTNHPLISACAETDLPLILSTGMSHERDIQSTSQLLRTLMVEHAFLHCNSTYPAPPQDINLAYIPRLREITRTVVGYSSHDGNPVIPVGSIAYGASIIEFHITRSHVAKGTDHRASIEIEMLPAFVKDCALMYEASGKALPRKPSQGELANRQSLGKSYALAKDRPAGHRLTSSDLILISPGSGFGINEHDNLVGQTLMHAVVARRLLKPTDLKRATKSFQADLNKAVAGLRELGYVPGIPVRYHDVNQMQHVFGMPMLEFHMSDRDLQLDPSAFLHEPLNNVDLIVHAVEQYEDGFILDLSSNDPLILQRSFEEIQRLCNHINSLRSFFRPRDRVPVVLNLGGFTSDGFVDNDEYLRTLERAVSSLEQLAELHSELQLLPQTMPPFPWHQGGRSYHNLLTSNDRVNDFLTATNTDLCFDISHTSLSCAYFGEQIEDHIATMAGRIKHLHLSDAQGTNAEGLEVGEGSINFRSLHEAMHANGQTLYMIPEIWQGHLQGGEKFASSLIRFHERLL